MNLAEKKCVPCEGGTPPLSSDQVKTLLGELTLPWNSADNSRISHEFKFKDFKGAIAFVNRVADIAELEGHHPDIHIHYNRVLIELWTHVIGGLSKNDFILARKIETL